MPDGTRETRGTERTATDEQAQDPAKQVQPADNAHAPAADAAVRRLLQRLGVSDGTPRGAEATARMASQPQHQKPVEDSEVEALSHNELRAFEARLTASIDPNLVAAIKASGGIVAFMKAMAAGKTIDGINEEKFVQLWNTSADEAWLKDKFRAADDGMHEWIPSNQIEAVVEKAKTSKEGATWVDLQNELRSPTNTVIFGPKEGIAAPDGKGLLLQGHVGALYLKGVMQTKKEAEFHDQLRAAFAAAKDIGDCVDKLKLVMLNWMWTGEKLPQPLHPDLQDSVGKPIDEAKLQSSRASTFHEMTTLFDNIKAKFAGGGGHHTHK